MVMCRQFDILLRNRDTITYICQQNLVRTLLLQFLGKSIKFLRNVSQQVVENRGSHCRWFYNADGHFEVVQVPPVEKVGVNSKAEWIATEKA